MSNIDWEKINAARSLTDRCGFCLVSSASITSDGIRDACWEHKESCSIYQEKIRRGDPDWFPTGIWG